MDLSSHTRNLLDKSEFPIFYSAIMDRKKRTAKRKIKSKRDLNLIHSAIWSTITRLYEESEGGVYIENVGYFCHVIKTHRKWVVNPLTDAPTRPRTNGYPYRHVVLDMGKQRRCYHIFRSIQTHLRKKLGRLSPEKRYKLRFNEVVSYINCTKKRKVVSLYKKK